MSFVRVGFPTTSCPLHYSVVLGASCPSFSFRRREAEDCEEDCALIRKTPLRADDKKLHHTLFLWFELSFFCAEHYQVAPGNPTNGEAEHLQEAKGGVIMHLQRCGLNIVVRGEGIVTRTSRGTLGYEIHLHGCADAHVFLLDRIGRIIEFSVPRERDDVRIACTGDPAFSA